MKNIENLIEEVVNGKDPKQAINEDLSLTDQSKRVIDSFANQTKDANNKLSTDGMRLDGLWMGGRDIAHWEGGKIVLGTLDSRSKQTIHHYLEKNHKHLIRSK